ncbi:MAG: O-sialoglycoprotein endopeptidase, partial [Clostridiales bacterium]
RTLAQVLQNISFQTGCKRILLAGGVMANSLIRCYLKAKLSSKMELLFADSHYAGDNSVGVAVLGLEKYQAEKY